MPFCETFKSFSLSLSLMHIAHFSNAFTIHSLEMVWKKCTPTDGESPFTFEPMFDSSMRHSNWYLYTNNHFITFQHAICYVFFFSLNVAKAKAQKRIVSWNYPHSYFVFRYENKITLYEINSLKWKQRAFGRKAPTLPILCIFVALFAQNPLCDMWSFFFSRKDINTIKRFSMSKTYSVHFF